MRLATFELEGASTLGCVQDDHITPVSVLGDFPRTMLALIAAGPETWQQLKKAVSSPGKGIPLSQVRLLTPLPNPPNNVICLGLNYASHVAESAPVLDKDLIAATAPVVFSKARSSLNSPYGEIPYDADVSTQIDWEVELGVVIGATGRHIPLDKALDYVFGYTIINDISARDVQMRHKQFFLGKSLDGSCPIGPWIVTADELTNPQSLRLRTYVNGVTKQSGSTADQIHDIATTISTLSRYMTLQPGDIIATGTPDGVGSARTPPEFLKPGDFVECEIDGIGRIGNRIVAVSTPVVL